MEKLVRLKLFILATILGATVLLAEFLRLVVFASQPDVILITIDTLRADHVSAYGYKRATTPRIDQLAAESVLFTEAHTVAAWTVPSVVSLLTGLHPLSHGVNSGLRNWEKAEVLEQPEIPASLPLLPELMKQAGYKTFGVTENGHLPASLGFGRGFDFYSNSYFVETLAAHKEITQSPLYHEPGPRFIWIHYYAPHAPYLAREPWATEWARAAGTAIDRVPELIDPSGYEKFNYKRGSQEIAALEARYDSEIRATDEAVREALESLDPEKKALVILAADHGEEFLDHGNYGHSNHYPETAKIPLLVRYPNHRFAGVRSSRLSSILDIAPTILTEAGADVPKAFQGAILQDLGTSPQPDTRELALHTRRGPGQRSDSLRAVTRMFHHFLGPPKDFDVLYDVVADPRQEHPPLNDAEQTTEFASRLAKLEQIYSEAKTAIVQYKPLSSAEAERLKTLGYIN